MHKNTKIILKLILEWERKKQNVWKKMWMCSASDVYDAQKPSKRKKKVDKSRQVTDKHKRPTKNHIYFWTRDVRGEIPFSVGKNKQKCCCDRTYTYYCVYSWYTRPLHIVEYFTDYSEGRDPAVYIMLIILLIIIDLFVVIIRFSSSPLWRAVFLI